MADDAVDFEFLLAPFAERDSLAWVEDCSTATVKASDMPRAYRELLDHDQHMTVTVEKHFGDAVSVEVLDSVQTGQIYARQILLRAAESGRVVQYGLVHVDLGALAAEVRDEILAGKSPLGTVLIRHEVLREVRPAGFYRMKLGADLAKMLGATAGASTYGRFGVIRTGGRVAVWVAEVLAPLET